MNKTRWSNVGCTDNWLTRGGVGRIANIEGDFSKR